MKSKFLKDLKINKIAKRTEDILMNAIDECEKDIGKPLENAEWDDILAHLEHLKEDDYAQSTIELRKSKLKQFYGYCFDETEDSKYIKIARKLSGTIEAEKELLPQEILVESDIIKMINASTLEWDRCVVMVLWESGMRIGEILNLNQSMVEINHKHEDVTFHIPNKPGSNSPFKDDRKFAIYRPCTC